jgi:hypothetical protein
MVTPLSGPMAINKTGPFGYRFQSENGQLCVRRTKCRRARFAYKSSGIYSGNHQSLAVFMPHQNFSQMPNWLCPRFIVGQHVGSLLYALHGHNTEPNAATPSAFCLCLIDSGTQLSNECSVLSHSRCRQRRGQCPQSLSEWAVNIFRGRYEAMLPPADLSNLSSAAKATISASRLKFVTAGLTTNLLMHEVSFLPAGSNLKDI